MAHEYNFAISLEWLHRWNRLIEVIRFYFFKIYTTYLRYPPTHRTIFFRMISCYTFCRWWWWWRVFVSTLQSICTKWAIGTSNSLMYGWPALCNKINSPPYCYMVEPGWIITTISTPQRTRPDGRTDESWGGGCTKVLTLHAHELIVCILNRIIPFDCHPRRPPPHHTSAAIHPSKQPFTPLYRRLYA